MKSQSTFQLHFQIDMNSPVPKGLAATHRVIMMIGTRCVRFVTARIRRMREGNIFSLFTLVGGGGVPHPRSGWGLPHPAEGGTPSKIMTGGYPRVPPVQDWMGYPNPGLDGVPPVQGWMRYTPPRQQSEQLLRRRRTFLLTFLLVQNVQYL